MYELRDELEELADRVIESNSSLRFIKDYSIRIAYMFSDKTKRKSTRIVYADTEKVNDKIKTLLPYDFIITFYQDSEDLPQDRMEILMKHELKHIGYEDGVCKINPHDVEDFSDIIQEHGINWVL